jgi:hypothetical protein
MSELISGCRTKHGFLVGPVGVCPQTILADDQPVIGLRTSKHHLQVRVTKTGQMRVSISMAFSVPQRKGGVMPDPVCPFCPSEGSDEHIFELAKRFKLCEMHAAEHAQQESGPLQTTQLPAHAAGEWVSVKDRLPEVNQRVLAFVATWDKNADQPFLAHYGRPLGWEDTRRGRMMPGVTHWAPLFPPSPQGDSNG